MKRKGTDEQTKEERSGEKKRDINKRKDGSDKE